MVQGQKSQGNLRKKLNEKRNTKITTCKRKKKTKFSKLVNKSELKLKGKNFQKTCTLSERMLIMGEKKYVQSRRV